MSLPTENNLPSSRVNPHDFPDGRILVAIVFTTPTFRVNAYRLDNYSTPLREPRWWAPKDGCEAEVARVLAYSGEKIGARYKSAREVWREMLPMLELIPQLDE